MKGIVLENCYINLRELASKHKLVYGMTHDIIVDNLGMRHVTARLVPKRSDFHSKILLKDSC